MAQRTTAEWIYYGCGSGILGGSLAQLIAKFWPAARPVVNSLESNIQTVAAGVSLDAGIFKDDPLLSYWGVTLAGAFVGILATIIAFYLSRPHTNQKTERVTNHLAHE